MQASARALLGRLQANALPNDAEALAAAVADAAASDQMRTVAAERLGALGSAASAHLDAFGALLTNGDASDGARIAAAEAIGSIGGGTGYLEDILEQGDHVDEGVWIACQKAHGDW